MPRRGLPLIVAVGVFIALVAVACELIAALGYRFHTWALDAAIRVVVIGSWVAAVGGVFCLLAALATRPGTSRRGFSLSLFGLIFAIVGFAAVIQWRTQAKNAPPIHDISTNLTVLDTAVAETQRRAYPDIQPVTLPVPPGAAFHIALAAARDMGWTIVGVDSASGHIGATATTTWFGFTDDITVTISPDPKGSRVDMRSASRVAASDAGRNAARIRKYEQRLTARV